MIEETRQIEDYLREVLGVSASLSPVRAARRLPMYLREGYRFYHANLIGMACLLMVDRADEAPSPATVRKQMDQLGKKLDGELIYVRQQVASHQRKRLIEQRVPFLVPGNQMYLPMLGIDLREHFRKARQAALTLTPATQALVLQLVLHRDHEATTPAEFAQRLGYTKMTMTRAFDELETEQLCDISKEGRERRLRLRGGAKELWENALPLLRTPVKQRKLVVWPPTSEAGVAAGLDALSRGTMIASPDHPVVAVSKERWKELKGQLDDLPAMADDPHAVAVEVWMYDPALFATAGIVDPLSLYLSLREEQDERVESALEQLMETVEW